ncbi:MAG TPA: SCO family protein [Mycobacteriales bacterium]|nr:SCO family protein [Mycobacteriales bacterium]
MRRSHAAIAAGALAVGCVAGGTAGVRGVDGSSSNAHLAVAATSLAHLDSAEVGNLLHGGVLTPPDHEPGIVLTDTSGARYNIRSRGAGHVTLVYFGYTHCPDVCPTTMADIAQALRQSSAAVRRRVTVVFVTVDPYRDSRQVLRRWLNGFDSSFVGLRGSLAQVVAAQQAAGLPVSRVERNGKTIEHSAEVLAYTPDHVAHVLYTEGPSTIDDLRHDLPILVAAPAYDA